MLKNVTIEVDGQPWKVRDASNIEAAYDEVYHAKATGSIGGSTTVNGELISDVVKLNEDGTERQPYGERCSQVDSDYDFKRKLGLAGKE
jgi:hypothetical protein